MVRRFYKTAGAVFGEIMKSQYIIAMSISAAVLAFCPGCKSRNIAETDNNGDAAAMQDGLPDGADAAQAVFGAIEQAVCGQDRCGTDKVALGSQDPTLKMAKIADAWVDAMDDDAPDADAFYEKAYGLIKEQSGEKAPIVVRRAMRLGDWAVVSVGIDDKLDGSASQVLRRHAYAVDLANGRIVGRDDWRAAIPLYRAVFERISSDRSVVTQAFVDNMARCAAAIAAENNEILIPDEETAHPAGISRPVLKVSRDSMELVWFSANSAAAPVYIRYALTYRDGSIFFASEIDDSASAKETDL